MNTLTHLGISQILQKNIESMMGIKLHKIGFMYGNIKPDISSSLIKIPHFKEASFDFITGEIKELMSMKIIGSGRCPKYFSERLGVVSHYISDYFCAAHSKSSNGSMLEHHLYEMKLSQYFNSNSASIKKSSFLRNAEIITDFETLTAHLDRLHSRYLETALCFESDVLYTLKAAVDITASVVMSAVLKPFYAAA